MSHLLCGLAGNPALPAELTDRLVALVTTAYGPGGAGHTDEERDDGDDLDEPDDVNDPGDLDDLDDLDDLVDLDGLVDALTGRPGLSRAHARALAAYGHSTALYLAHSGKLAAADVDPMTMPYVAVALLDHGSGPPQWARLLAAHPDPLVREKLASCPVLPPGAARILAADPEVAVVAELALWASADLAADLARHPHAEVRRAASSNEAVPPAALAALITGEGLPAATACLVCDREGVPFHHDPYCPRPDCDLRPGAACDGSHASTASETLQWAARNPSTPVAAASSLAGHPSMVIRGELAERSDLSQELYERLAADPVPGVYATVAGNPAIGEALIRRLAVDPRKEVRARVARHPRLPLDVLAELAGTAGLGPGPLPRISSATPAELAELAASPLGAVRMRLAERRDLPPELRDALAADPDASVVKAIAPHPGLSEELLRAAVARHGVRVLAGVAANPDAPGSLLAKLARHEPPVRRALRAISVHRNATAEALLPCLTDAKAAPYAAAHPALPPAVLTALVKGADEHLAEAAAGNPSLPTALMEKLIPHPGAPDAGPEATPH